MSENDTATIGQPSSSEVDMPCLVRRSWRAWLEFSGHDENTCPFEGDYKFWLSLDTLKIAVGSEASRVQTFHAGFLAANRENSHSEPSETVD